MSTRYIRALRKRGYTIRLASDGALIINPKLPENLLKQVVENKPAIVAEIEALMSQPADFLEAFGFVKVHSVLLDDEIIIAQPGTDTSIFAGPTYTVQELADLGLTNDREYIRFAHQVRRTGDPRPDLIKDTSAWQKLLRIANLQRSSIAGILHGFRCCGAMLRRDVSGWHIVYEPEQSTGFLDQADFKEQYKRWLMPAGDINTRRDAELTSLLRAMV